MRTYIPEASSVLIWSGPGPWSLGSTPGLPDQALVRQPKTGLALDPGPRLKGPGAALFRAVTEALGDVAIIAEDLGDFDRKSRAGLDAL